MNYSLLTIGGAAILVQNVPWKYLLGIGTNGIWEGNLAKWLPNSDRMDQVWDFDLAKASPEALDVLKRVGYGSDQTLAVAFFIKRPRLMEGITFWDGSRWVFLVEFAPRRRTWWEEQLRSLGSIDMYIDAPF